MAALASDPALVDDLSVLGEIAADRDGRTSHTRRIALS